MTDTYAVTNLPIQSDLDSSTPWILSGQLCGTPTPARITTNADLSRSAAGFTSSRWGLKYMTFDMFGYWNATFIPGGAWSAPVTIMDYDDSNQAVFYTATIWRPAAPSDKAQVITGGWAQVIYEWTKGVQLFP
jgi:hypothetical protein